MSIGLARIVWTLKTPLSRPTKCSPDLTSHPSHTPSFQRSSYLPGMSLVFGMRKCTISPNSANFPFDRLPFIIWKAVRPWDRILHRVTRYPACRISHGVMGLSRPQGLLRTVRFGIARYSSQCRQSMAPDRPLSQSYPHAFLPFPSPCISAHDPFLRCALLVYSVAPHAST